MNHAAKHKKTQLWKTTLVVSDLQSHPRSMISSHLKGRMQFSISDQ